MHELNANQIYYKSSSGWKRVEVCIFRKWENLEGIGYYIKYKASRKKFGIYIGIDKPIKDSERIRLFQISKKVVLEKWVKHLNQNQLRFL